MRDLIVGLLASLSLTASLPASESVPIDTREGTWMSVDVSPDGQRLVFDLLGDLYSLPIRGGEAKRLTTLPKPIPGEATDRAVPTGGQAFDSQPRFSPDGTEIVFVSDRDGADNLYRMRTDGSGLRRLTTGRDVFMTPEWSPDGKFVAVRRTPAAGGGGGSLWVYRADGSGGYPVDLQQARSITGPTFGPGGDSVYYATRLAGNHQIWRFEKATGRTTQMTQCFGGALRPRVSPDGRSLAYATFDDGETVLRLRNLVTGEDRSLLRGIEQGLFVTGGGRLDGLPGYGFSPDGTSIYLSYGGKLHRVGIAKGPGEGVEDVPFHVDTRLAIGPAVSRKATLIDGEMPVRMLHWAAFAPDARFAVFDAIGKLWRLDDAGSGGQPRRLTSEVDREYAPAISPDGDWVVYVRWSDRRRGSVMKVAAGGGTPIELTRVPGYYAHPTWSPDGSRIVVAVGGGADLQGQASIHDLSRTLSWLPAEGAHCSPSRRSPMTRARATCISRACATSAPGSIATEPGSGTPRPARCTRYDSTAATIAST